MCSSDLEELPDEGRAAKERNVNLAEWLQDRDFTDNRKRNQQAQEKGRGKRKDGDRKRPRQSRQHLQKHLADEVQVHEKAPAAIPNASR